MNDIKHLILDMDGVLWRGETPMPGLSTFFEFLNAQDYGYVLATNNAMRTAEDYVAKLAKFGVQVSARQVLTSSEATASYVQHTFERTERVYVMGEPGLKRVMEAAGFSVLTPEDVKKGERCRLVVAGLSRQSLTYDLLAMASLLIHEGATFIATNNDATYPTELGPLPGAGAVLSVLETATGVQPTVIGKPAPYMFQEALRRLNSPADKTVMVGDRLSTDIAGGQQAGLRTVLLLSGVTSQKELSFAKIQPDYIYDDIQALQRALASS